MILIIGLPNAGKTTYSQRFENVLHVDDYAPNKCARCTEAAAKLGGNVVVEGVFHTREKREALLKVATGKKTCIWINATPDECRLREARGRSELIVWQAEQMFEPPTLAEGWDEIIIIENHNQEVKP